jgi:hypothetical protein
MQRQACDNLPALQLRAIKTSLSPHLVVIKGKTAYSRVKDGASTVDRIINYEIDVYIECFLGQGVWNSKMLLRRGGMQTFDLV